MKTKPTESSDRRQLLDVVQHTRKWKLVFDRATTPSRLDLFSHRLVQGMFSSEQSFQKTPNLCRALYNVDIINETSGGNQISNLLEVRNRSKLVVISHLLFCSSPPVPQGSPPTLRLVHFVHLYVLFPAPTVTNVSTDWIGIQERMFPSVSTQHLWAVWRRWTRVILTRVQLYTQAEQTFEFEKDSLAGSPRLLELRQTLILQ